MFVLVKHQFSILQMFIQISMDILIQLSAIICSALLKQIKINIKSSNVCINQGLIYSFPIQYQRNYIEKYQRYLLNKDRRSSIDEFQIIILEMSKRMRWTNDELEKLKEIYTQELEIGSKRLWIRITERINKTVRPAKRQAIQYKWKNFGKNSTNAIKLRQNQRLIDLLFEQIPEKGYKDLSQSEYFEGITESNIKNIFYSNIRSISNFLHIHLQVKEQVRQIINMLKYRKFLLLLKNKGIIFSEFRNKINSFKRKIVEKNLLVFFNQEEIQSTKYEIIEIYEKIRRIYLENQVQRQSITTLESKENQENQDTIITRALSIKTEQIPLNVLTSIQLLENVSLIEDKFPEQDYKQGSLMSIGDWQSQIFPVQFNKAVSSSDWLYNDF